MLYLAYCHLKGLSCIRSLLHSVHLSEIQAGDYKAPNTEQHYRNDMTLTNEKGHTLAELSTFAKLPLPLHHQPHFSEHSLNILSRILAHLYNS